MNSGSSATILLVEDDPNDVEFMTLALRKAGLAPALRHVEDGAEAISYLQGLDKFADRHRFPLPAIVFLDLKIPRVPGLEVLKWIRSQAALDMVVVIVLTASQQRSDILAASSLCANSYLVKPSNPLELEEIVSLVKRYWLNLNQPTAAFGSLSE